MGGRKTAAQKQAARDRRNTLVKRHNTPGSTTDEAIAVAATTPIFFHSLTDDATAYLSPAYEGHGKMCASIHLLATSLSPMATATARDQYPSSIDPINPDFFGYGNCNPWFLSQEQLLYALEAVLSNMCESDIAGYMSSDTRQKLLGQVYKRRVCNRYADDGESPFHYPDVATQPVSQGTIEARNKNGKTITKPGYEQKFIFDDGMAADHAGTLDALLDMAVASKFENTSGGADMMCKLVETKGRDLVFAAPFDRTLGVGFGAEEAKWGDLTSWGRNLLGKAIMRYRDALSDEDIAWCRDKKAGKTRPRQSAGEEAKSVMKADLDVPAGW